MSNQASNGSDWASAIQTWFNEHSDYLYPHGKGCDHYTQVTNLRRILTYVCDKMQFCFSSLCGRTVDT